MLKINRYEDISQVDKESKKDYIDRHTPFIHCEKLAKKGELFSVTVKMGQEYSHPDDYDHYISNISLYAGPNKVAEAMFYAGALGGQGAKGHQTVTFNIVLARNTKITAQSYCIKHGIWESEPTEIDVS